MKKPSMTLKKILTAGLILVLTLCTLTACGGQSGDGESAEGTEELTTLVLGTSADYAPFEFMYPDDNGDMQTMYFSTIPDIGAAVPGEEGKRRAVQVLL